MHLYLFTLHTNLYIYIMPRACLGLRTRRAILAVAHCFVDLDELPQELLKFRISEL
jgi:hypothetical protein